MDVGGGDYGNNMQIQHTFSGKSERYWQYRVNYIPCDTTYTPPHGCLQWHTGPAGVAKSFNFDGNNIKLLSQYYTSVPSSCA
jgi:hypothetical protein